MNNLKHSSILLLIWVLVSSCEAAVEDLNRDPNSPTSAPADRVMTTTQVANILVHEGEIARRAGIWSGYFSGEDRQYQSFENYAVTAGDFDASWEDIYVNVIRNARVARGEDLEGKTDILLGITKVLEAQAAGTAAVLWGDIPFTEVGILGENYPVYESQEEVFALIHDLLDSAIADLSDGSTRPSSGSDIHFDGNPDSWLEVAYTLKARIYMFTKDYEGAYQAALKGISRPANSLLSVHQEAQDARNLYYQVMTGNRGDDFSANDAYILALLSENRSDYRGNIKTDERARFNYYFTVESGITKPNYISANGFASATAEFPLISYEENQLILAEAGFRTQGFETGLEHLNTYREYLNDGGYIHEDFHEQGILYEAYTAADFATGGLENSNGALSQSEALLREILEERYITFFGQIEGFNDLRRTANEHSVKVQVTPTGGDEIPKRFLYPQTEIDSNPNVILPLPGFFEPTPVNQ